MNWSRGLLGWLGALLVAVATASCTTVRSPLAAGAVDPQERAAVIAEQLVALPGAGEKTRGEAGRLALEAVRYSQKLGAEYKVVTSAGLHNCLVNIGSKDRGLCWHWMEDLYPHLKKLELEHFRMVCGVRDPGRLFHEHHCVVAVPKGRPFEDGLVLDPWVKGGQLVGFPVAGAKRPWHYDPGWTIPLRQRHLMAKAGGGSAGGR